ncbi:hypothetical protein BDD14_6553 [Edaphobacter modestus]|uniref:Uncharacterized protein n=1 Tax=Edaphobacter modestus TaxID=388466 RepID=A0A4Q7XX70_9BACT|nr:hypothetical protein BDD14_6553 [Edaphobacter modestus]
MRELLERGVLEAGKPIGPSQDGLSRLASVAMLSKYGPQNVARSTR